MRRWNGWGDDTFTYPLPKSATRFLDKVVGPGLPTPDASLEDVLKQAPTSRLPAHPLVSTDAEDRVRHACGQSLPDWVAMKSGRFEAFPDGVAHPVNGDQVCELLRYAGEADAHVIPYGGGTSVVGHVNPLPGDAPVLTIDMGRMCHLFKFDEISNLATFGAGIKGPDLEAQLRARSRTLGHYPQSFEYSTLGGWIATRSCGQQSRGYGRIEALFAGGRIETPLGALEIPDSFPASAAGPDLRELVLGSEGRIGIITEATVRVSPLPECEEFHAVFFPDFECGREAVREILQAKLPISMARLSTTVETETTLAMAGHAVLIGGLEYYLAMRGADERKCMLILGITGTNALVKMARKEALDAASRRGGLNVGQTFGKTWNKSRFKSPYLRDSLWEAGYAIDTLETATRWADVPALVEAIEMALRTALLQSDEFVHVFTHLSHLYPSGSSIYTQYLFRRAGAPEETLRRWALLKAAASEVIVARGGTISHQHGVGLDHRPYLPAEKGELGMKALTTVIQTFDPKGMMNPGKLVA